MTTTTTQALPHWDMTVVFPSLESTEFEEAFDHYRRHVDDLVQIFDRHDVAAHDTLPMNGETVRAVESVLNASGAIQEEGTTLRSYIASFVSTDSRNTIAQARVSELSQRSVVLSQLFSRFTAWIGSVDVERLIELSPVAAEH